MSETRNVVRYGSFRRTSDSKVIPRFRCRACKKSFSHATHAPCVDQNKRHFNHIIGELLSNLTSQRAASRMLNLHRTTLARKFRFVAGEARILFEAMNRNAPAAECIQFDDIETFEHTKCKPLSVTIVVETKSRRILDFEVSQISPKGKRQSIKARRKYGERKNEANAGRKALFERLTNLVSPTAIIMSDRHPHYPVAVRQHFPLATHVTFKSKRGTAAGHGELKIRGYGPLFSVNHTNAMIRANVNRFITGTWCTTKKRECLVAHLYLYAYHHNKYLLEQDLKASARAEAPE